MTVYTSISNRCLSLKKKPILIWKIETFYCTALYTLKLCSGCSFGHSPISDVTACYFALQLVEIWSFAAACFPLYVISLLIYQLRLANVWLCPSWHGNSAVIAFVQYCSQGNMVNFVFLGLRKTFQLLGSLTPLYDGRLFTPHLSAATTINTRAFHRGQTTHLTK